MIEPDTEEVIKNFGPTIWKEDDDMDENMVEMEKNIDIFEGDTNRSVF